MTTGRVVGWPCELWEWPGLLPGDVGFDAFEAEVNVYEFDWNLAVWWNRDLAEVTRALAQQRRLGYMYDALDDLRPALTTANGMDTFMSIASRLPRSEARCAEHLAAAVQHVVKVNIDVRSGAWMVYDVARGVWRKEGEEGVVAVVTDCVLRFGMALGRAVDAARTMLDVVEPDPGPKPSVAAGASAQQVADWEEATERRDAMTGAIKGAREMARAIPRGKFSVLRQELRTRVGVEQTAWDGDMRWLVLRDGVVNVEEVARTGEVELVGFSPRHMSTMALDVAWQDETRNAGKSEWEAGVEKVLPDSEVRVYLQKRFGAALLGRPGIAGKSMVWQYGPGDTAKTTLQECVAGARGVFAPYATVVASEALTEKGGDKGAADRFKAYARGKRFVLMSELRAGAMLDQGLVKNVTGGETVEGTAKYANAVSYFFTATLFMASNHPPTFPPGDTALAGRIIVLPFEHRLWVRTKNPKEWAEAGPEHRADEDWAGRVLDSAQERRAIFSWVLDGLIAFGREGLGDVPAAMVDAREEFVSDADPVGKLVRTLLGTEPDWPGPAWLRVYSDQEWEAEGWYEGDGLPLARLEQLVTARARELGMVKFGEDGLSAKWSKAALRMLHELGGKKKKAMVDRDSRKTATTYTRVRELTSHTADATSQPAPGL